MYISTTIEDVPAVRELWRRQDDSSEPILPSSFNPNPYLGKAEGRESREDGPERRAEQGGLSRGWALLRAGFKKACELFG